MKLDTFFSGLIVLLLWEDAFHPVESGHGERWQFLLITWIVAYVVTGFARLLWNSFTKQLNPGASNTAGKSGVLDSWRNLGALPKRPPFQTVPTAADSASPSKPPTSSEST